jgi:rsbT co-antagonist protein RsbR
MEGLIFDPGLDEQEKESLRLFWRVYGEHYDAISSKIAEVVSTSPEFQRLYDLPALQPTALSNRERMAHAFELDDWKPYIEYLNIVGAHYARNDVRLSLWFSLLHTIRAIQVPYLVEAYVSEPDKLASALNGLSKYLEISMATISETYVYTKEQTILKQRAAILELSTPVLPMVDGLLIMPIVGVVDTHRAQQLTQVLLHAIRDHRARIVVMDITGVPVVDSRVANHLIQSVDAARLMGAKVILTGLSAEVAQALVTVGVNLASITTKADLQSGIEAAYRRLKYTMVRVEDPLHPSPDED